MAYLFTRVFSMVLRLSISDATAEFLSCVSRGLWGTKTHVLNVEVSKMVSLAVAFSSYTNLQLSTQAGVGFHKRRTETKFEKSKSQKVEKIDFFGFSCAFRTFGLFDFSGFLAVFGLFWLFNFSGFLALFGLFGLLGFSTFWLFEFSRTFRTFWVFLRFDCSTFRVLLHFSDLLGFSTFRVFWHFSDFLGF